ncbi:putative ribonuclease H-like domain-containing protein [Tanacetum coccineum]
MEQYLTHTDYALWEVIVNGDAPAIVALASTSAESPIPPKTAKQKLARKNELKAKSTLLLAIPDEHLLKFHACKDAKSLWEAIKNRFRGNKESKKMKKTILKQNYENFAASIISQEDANLKLLRSLPSAWNNIALIMRNKSDLDTLSMDDLYNNLKYNSSSTNEIVNTAYSVSAASSKDQASTASYADDVMFSFFSNQSNVPQLDYKDLEQIDADDLAEIYLKWQVAMLTMRVKRDRAGAPRNQGNRNRDAPRRNAPVDTSTTNALVVQDGIGKSLQEHSTSISTARPVNIVAPKPKVNDALPTTYSYFKAHSPVRRAFNQKSAAKTNKFNEKVNTARFNNVISTGPKAVVSAVEGNGENAVKSSACWIWRPTGNVIDHNSKDSGSYMLKRFNYVDLTRQTQVSNGLVPKRTNPLTLSSRYSWVFFLATNDETSGILKTFITGIENQINHKVKIIRCDNRTEFKNNDMNQFCGMKGIKRQFSVARTPQQNKVAKRKNRTLIEAARTMLADSLLPTTFWVEAVNTARYVQNRVLVTKPHNKTPYELLHGRPPSISFMRPFGCHVTILNTLDPLGKFDRKVNEGFLVGYSINSKAFRVFNTRTRKVEENLHITFLENKPNIAGSGPDWLFDIDLLTNSMNYEPVTAGNQTNRNAVADDAGKKTNEKPANKGERNGQEKEGGASNKEGYTTSTNRVSTISPSVSDVGQIFDNADDLPNDPLMPDLEDTADLLNTCIFSGAYDDEDEGAEADLNNLETTMNVSPIPTTRIHKDHLNDQIIGDINSATQTRRMTKIFEEHALVSYINKQRRTNHKDYQNRLFACFLSQKEPKKVIQALDDPSWIEAMQEELLQFKLQKCLLYGTIEEEVYVCQPPGFEDPQFPDKVYKVEKALYGLHQAPRAWYETLSTYLLENRFRRGTIDKTLFIKKDKVKQKDDGIFISQDKYVADILKKFDFATVKTASTPIETNKALLKDEEAEDVDVHLYRSMIGSLMYLTASRPDIMFVVYHRFDLEGHILKSDYSGASLNRNPQQRFNFMNTKNYINNESTICIVKNPVFHSKTKYIEIRHHFIRDSYEKKLIQVIKIHKDQNVAYLLMKAFDVRRFQYLIASIGMLNPLTANDEIQVSIVGLPYYW